MADKQYALYNPIDKITYVDKEKVIGYLYNQLIELSKISLKRISLLVSFIQNQSLWKLSDSQKIRNLKSRL